MSTGRADLELLAALRGGIGSGTSEHVIPLLCRSAVTPELWQAAVGDLSANRLLSPANIRSLAVAGPGLTDMACRVLLASATPWEDDVIWIVRTTPESSAPDLLDAMIEMPSERVLLLAMTSPYMADWWTVERWTHLLETARPRMRERALAVFAERAPVVPFPRPRPRGR